jgi:hypothetical protein
MQVRATYMCMKACFLVIMLSMDYILQ